MTLSLEARDHARSDGLDETGFRALDEATIDRIGAELDAIRAEVTADLGAEDAAYIRRIIRIQRSLELTGRVVLLFSILPPAWLVGTAALSVAKILENMEIGHNVLHGQWDWMRDDKIHSTTWDWDAISPVRQWQRSHNDTHHTWTNVLGRDEDLGYGIIRVDEKQPWTLASLPQPLVAILNAMFFEYGIAAYDMRLGPYLKGEVDREEFRRNAREVLAKLRRQVTRDYLVHPLLSGPSFLHTLTANVVANVVRNVWSNSIIICGHFPDNVQTFTEEDLVGETRGRWYVRQMLGSANISGGRLLHILSGNLSHQIEHHLFPDLPSNRLAEVAPKVRAILERHGLEYVTGPFHRQLGQVWATIFRLSLPNKEVGRSRLRTIGAAVADKLGVRRSRAALSRSLRTHIPAVRTS
ncbi:fatty acid desaturase family protein [Enemella evansiae]|nr:acyl-CoA desaturase [Enemella evansiae]OYN97431.1 acyl-CoA desaturase [Enemella evansiae]OYN99852.1 acyl-CoA desaturase [Enemella evansiae]OYO11183.1 acyl-CoA desaturase [Enemella evansiae]